VTFPGVLSNFQHHVSGTRCHKQYCTATLFLNPDLKLIDSLKLSLNTDPTSHQQLINYDRMTLYKFDYYYSLFIYFWDQYIINGSKVTNRRAINSIQCHQAVNHNEIHI